MRFKNISNKNLIFICFLFLLILIIHLVFNSFFVRKIKDSNVDFANYKNIEIGMDIKDVIEIMGQPNSISKINDATEFSYYASFDPEPYIAVIFSASGSVTHVDSKTAPR